ncbi:hybrid signal transduction histidine kinase B [Drosophila hydei]|uniref:Hybrid signal transduction histidine kinase B n=1 Tax=Drosophila hydei TaxID=7224 RepID=A0A6J1LGX4_DROHY|nr:hybrid signal transduction histidine kinase B [Drosophila hydei]
MSYLLTEIALEMLGYKFYDTDGVFHLINFQQSTTAAQSDGQTHPEEPSLMEFIDQPSDTDSEKNNGHEQAQSSTVPSTIKLRGTPVRALAKMMEYQSDKMHNGNEEQEQQQKQQTQQQSQPQPQHQQQPPKRSSSSSVETESSHVVPTKSTSTARRTPTRALANIMSYEIDKIRNQIILRMEKALKKEPGRPSQEALQEGLKAELKKLARDANEMQEFRQFLEERLRRIDSRPYEAYVRTFRAE